MVRVVQTILAILPLRLSVLMCIARCLDQPLWVAPLIYVGALIGDWLAIVAMKYKAVRNGMNTVYPNLSERQLDSLQAQLRQYIGTPLDEIFGMIKPIQATHGHNIYKSPNGRNYPTALMLPPLFIFLAIKLGVLRASHLKAGALINDKHESGGRDGFFFMLMANMWLMWLIWMPIMWLGATDLVQVKVNINGEITSMKPYTPERFSILRQALAMGILVGGILPLYLTIVLMVTVCMLGLSKRESTFSQFRLLALNHFLGDRSVSYKNEKIELVRDYLIPRLKRFVPKEGGHLGDYLISILWFMTTGHKVMVRIIVSNQ